MSTRDPLEFCCGQSGMCGYGGCYPYREPPKSIEEIAAVALSAPSGDAQGERAHGDGTAAQGSVQGRRRGRAMSDVTVAKRGCAIEDCERPHRARGWCTRHYRRWQVSGNPNYERPRRPDVCTVDGCENATHSSVHCQMHRFRLRRNGSLDLPERAGKHLHSGGYIFVRRPGHALAQPRHKYWVYEHRVVLFDDIGPGWHNCHHCGTAVSWDLTYPEHIDALVVDHLDSDPANNGRSNLVPSCASCNSRRATRKRAEDVP